MRARAAWMASIAAGALVVALPAGAATPVVRAVAGPGFVLAMTPRSAKPGRVRLVVADRSDAHNFHLIGPGVNVRTGVSAIATRTFAITLQKGTYRFVCDPHRSFMKGTFTVR